MNPTDGLSEQMKCPACGASNQQAASACAMCGPGPVRPQPPAPDKAKTGKSFLRWLLPLVACLALAAAAGIYFGKFYAKRYPVPEAGVSFAFPDGYAVATAEGEVPDAILTKYGKDRATMETYFSMLDVELSGVPKLPEDSIYEIHVRVRGGFDEIGDLRQCSRSYQEEAAKAMIAGFARTAADDSIAHTLYETPEALFVVFSYSGDGYRCRYMTILNGKMITVFGYRPYMELTAEDREALAFVADSMRSE